MATSPDLFDATTRHSIYLTRYSSSVVNRMVALINRADPDLMVQITVALERMPRDSFSVERLELLLASFRSLNASLFGEISTELLNEIRQFSAYEAGFQVRMLASAATHAGIEVSFASASAEAVYAAALSRPMQGVLLREALAGVEAATAKRVRDAIRIGYVEGEPIAKIVQRIKGTRAAGYADGLLDWSRRDIGSVVRTAVAHTANVARQETYAANDDIVREWLFVATLDSRVTVTCASLSGKRFPIGKGPMPPRHYNCRSSSVPLLAGQKQLFGTRASVDYSGDRPKGKQIDANVGFSTWLRGQPASVQDEILGSTRGRLFRANKIEVDRFTDSRGNMYTLDELRRRDAALFGEDERRAA
jgi:SPP1 gp7 family putative phage head morphogenesis protein